MNATFVQVDEAELSRIQAEASPAETRFRNGPFMPPACSATRMSQLPSWRASDAATMGSAIVTCLV
jgi:hypothetical protein